MKESIAELAKYFNDKYNDARNCSMIRRLPVSSQYPWRKYDTYDIPKELAKSDSLHIDIRNDVHLPMLRLYAKRIKMNKIVKDEIFSAKELIPDDCNLYLFG